MKLADSLRKIIAVTKNALQKQLAVYHLPGLFEFYDFYRLFLPLYREHREFFFDWCDIGSIYGAPAGCRWNGGRTGAGDIGKCSEVLDLMREYKISARLTFSNSMLSQKDLADEKCNDLCRMLQEKQGVENGVIIHSEVLLDYLRKNYPGLYFVSSTTKVLTDFRQLLDEINREEFRFVVPDFRLNNAFEKLTALTECQRNKVEFLCNECCWIGCRDRKQCYETVSRQNLDASVPDFRCTAPGAEGGYRFSSAMRNPAFIGINDIQQRYLPERFFNFKIEGRGLGSALLLEFILYYMTRPECHIKLREEIYLDNSLDLF